MRGIWSGTIAFGLVNVGVRAFTAVRDHSVRFHQIDRSTGARIGYQKISKDTGDAVDASDIASAYEVADNEYVIVERGEIESLKPESTKKIQVEDFVELDAIDPVYFDKTYWLAPDGEANQQAYGLLAAAMNQRRRVGIGTVVMRNNQYLAAIRPVEDALLLSTMRFSDEIVGREQISELLPEMPAPSERELALATQIIDALDAKWDPERYHDTFTEELLELIKAKADGSRIVSPDTEEQGGKVIDLMAALEASVDAARAQSS